MRDPIDLEALAEAVADGTPLDWDRIEASVSGESRETVRSLRAMSTIAGLHRTLAAQSDGPSSRAAAPPAIATAIPVDRPLPRWGHFALEERIGAGSFGEVFRAVDTRLDRRVAVKLARGESHEATLVEARLLARVRHPNVAAVYGADTFDGQPGLWMELIDGLTLSTVLLRQGPFAEAEAATIGLHLCRALSAVHAAGLLHRDIKAQNVMRESGGRIVLMDFGGGREASLRPAVGGDTGTPVYLAPEVLDGQPATARSDGYALGVLLYHLVTREFPVKGSDPLSLAAAHKSGARVPLGERRPDLSPRFVSVVDRATARDPENRYATAGAMAADLAHVLHAEIDGSAPVATAPRSRTWLMFVAAAAAALAVAAGVWLSTRGPAAGGSPVGSILVLPLTDTSPDRAQQPYLAAGFTNVLSEDLGRIRSLRIIRSARAEKIAAAARPALARELGADAYLQGTLARGNGRVELNVRLVDASSGAVRWSGSFDRAADQGLSVHREIARTLAEALDVALSAEERRVLSTTEQVSVRAQDAYLRGWSEYHRFSRDGVLEAGRQFEEAIKLQPTFAAAHAALSQVYWSIGTSLKTMTRDESRARAETTALRAIELDPMLPNGYAALGQVRQYFDWDWREAEELFRRAVELNPNVAVVRVSFAWLLAAMNRLGPAHEEMRAAIELEPDNTNWRAAAALVMYYSRRFDDAIAETQTLVAQDPNSLVGRLALARYLTEAGRPADGAQQLALARYRSEPAVVAELARIHAKAGNTSEARRLVPQLISASEAGTLARDYLAFVYLALGESEHALALLEVALAERSPTLVWLQVDPRFDALRTDSRFVSVLRQLGFEQ